MLVFWAFCPRPLANLQYLEQGVSHVPDPLSRQNNQEGLSIKEGEAAKRRLCSQSGKLQETVAEGPYLFDWITLRILFFQTCDEAEKVDGKRWCQCH